MGGEKAGGGFLGIGGQGGFLGTGLLGSGPKKIKGMGFTSGVRAGEDEAIQRQRQIASGQAPSIANMALQQNLDQVGRQAMSMAASQRGASNPALAFRQAQMAQQQAALEGAQQGAILAEQERRQADEFLARQAAAQRGVALQQAQTNLGAKQLQQGQNLQFFGNLAGSAAQIATGQKKGAAYGGEIPGKPVVDGDSPVNDTEQYMLSPGEIVIPRSAAKDRESAIKFLDAIKFENEKRKGKKEEPEESEGIDVASMAKLFHEMTKLKGK